MGALACLAQILGQGNNSILYQQLVKKQLALQANCIQPLSELSGEFTFQVTPYPGKSLATYVLCFDIMHWIAFEARGVTDEDIEKFKGGIEAQLINGLQSVSGKVSNWRISNYTGNPNMIGELIKMYQAVTKEDVMRVYNQYIK